MSFLYSHVVKFHETDAARRLFFAEQLKIAHDAYEEFLCQGGLRLGDIVAKSDYSLPIVHTEADFHAPLFVGDKITVRIEVERVGKTSFTLDYTFSKAAGQEVGTVKTVHVAVDKVSGTSRRLPAELQELLEQAKKRAA